MIMRDLEDLVRCENANSALAFRERAYLANEHAELLRDLLGLANAPVSGPRLLVVGVRDGGDRRRIVGVAAQAWSDFRTRLEALLGDSIEPPLEVAVRALQIDGALVGVVCLTACDDPPYLLSARGAGGLPAGSGWIRRGTQLYPLLRTDLQRVFAAKYAAPPIDVALRIGFPGDVPQSEIALPALELDALPSAVVAANLRKVLEAKQNAKDVLGRTETQVARLVHAQVFGVEQPYESHSDESLRLQIARTADDYRAADEHYAFEVRAHKLELVVANPGATALRAATLRATLPRLETIGIAERLYTNGDGPTRSDAYPRVQPGKHTVSIEVDIGTIPRGSVTSAFREPPRLWARRGAAGKTIPVDVTLYARELREPWRETLLIRILDRPAAATARGSQSATASGTATRRPR
jgi:hypothetical protein